MRFSFAMAFCLACCGNALAQTNDEPVVIVELGGAMGLNVKGPASSFGPDIAAEFTPIENWLEIEAGVTPFFTRNSTEWGTDLLFKKPWTLSKKAEFMAGLGPEWLHTKESGVTSNSCAFEAVLDFMFWPSTNRKFGWFVEPGYEYSFGRGHERSIGISAGLLIAFFPRDRH
ncbi:MAG: hypothetical protein JO270_20245 [Acidobacteriaceae bacterium]|nr:hypothetical protein [Acidobacteriaceae bacterium]